MDLQISVEQLQEHNACTEGLNAFKKAFQNEFKGDLVEVLKNPPNTLRPYLSWLSKRFNISLAGVNLSNCNLKNTNASKMNFEGADFSGSDLSDMDLSSCNLRGANFREANMSRVWLCGSNLIDADFTGANLSGADFYHAKLDRANLSNTRLDKTLIFAVTAQDLNVDFAFCNPHLRAYLHKLNVCVDRVQLLA